MAVKASQSITLYKSVDVSSVTLYFKTVNAGSSAPAKPTTATPTGWSTSEPALDLSKDLYATLKTTFTDDTFSYSDPQKYASYEAAKEAYNLADNATDAVAALQQKVSDYIVGTQTTTTRFWTGVSTIPSLQDGQQIQYWLPYATAYTDAGTRVTGVDMRVNSSTTKTAGTQISTFESGTSTNAVWLNLTLANNTETGWIPCYYGGTSRLTGHYGAGNSIRLTYKVNAKIAGEATTNQYTGWFADANYNSDTYDRMKYANAIKAKTAILSGRIIVGDSSGFFHLANGSVFDITKPILYAGSNIDANATGTNNYVMYSSVNLRNNIANITLTDKETVYIKGSLDGNTFTVNSLTTTVPTTDDGFYYISLGLMYSTYQCGLFPEHPIFKYVNGEFKSLNQVAYEAQIKVDEMPDYIASRGENLVTNGTAYLKDNTNFSQFTYDGSDTYYAGGSFKYTGKSVNKNNDEFIPVDVQETYYLSYYIKTDGSDCRFYDMFYMYDVDKLQISDHHVLYVTNTLTTLAQDLNNGDTKVYLTDVSHFRNQNNNYSRKLIFWDYKNSYGYLYAPETYSRNVYGSYGAPLWENETTSIDYANNVITLRVPWSGGTKLAGTPVSQGNNGATNIYMNSNYSLTPNTWTKKVGTMKGIGVNNEGGKFRQGTAFIKIGWYINWSATENRTTNISTVTLTKNSSIADTIESLDVEYYLSTSSSTPTGGSWSTTAPAWVNGKYMWSRQKLTYGNGTVEYKNQTCIAGATGATGAAGANTAMVYLYGRFSTAPTSRPYSSAVTYTFSTGQLSSVPSGWSQTIPAGDDPLYVSTAVVSSNTSTGSIAANSWTIPIKFVQDGSDGTGIVSITPLYYLTEELESPTAPTTDHDNETSYPDPDIDVWTRFKPGYQYHTWNNTATFNTIEDFPTLGEENFIYKANNSGNPVYYRWSFYPIKDYEPGVDGQEGFIYKEKLENGSMRYYEWNETQQVYYQVDSDEDGTYTVTNSFYYFITTAIEEHESMQDLPNPGQANVYYLVKNPTPATYYIWNGSSYVVSSDQNIKETTYYYYEKNESTGVAIITEKNKNFRYFTCNEIKYDNGNHNWSIVIEEFELNELYEQVITSELNLNNLNNQYNEISEGIGSAQQTAADAQKNTCRTITIYKEIPYDYKKITVLARFKETRYQRLKEGTIYLAPPVEYYSYDETSSTYTLLQTPEDYTVGAAVGLNVEHYQKIEYYKFNEDDIYYYKTEDIYYRLNYLTNFFDYWESVNGDGSGYKLKENQELWIKEAPENPGPPATVEIEQNEWSEVKPEWTDGNAVYVCSVWVFGDGRRLYSNPYWLTEYQKVEDDRYKETNKAYFATRGKNHCFNNENGYFVYNGDGEEDSTRRIIINQKGINFAIRSDFVETSDQEFVQNKEYYEKDPDLNNVYYLYEGSPVDNPQEAGFYEEKLQRFDTKDQLDHSQLTEGSYYFVLEEQKYYQCQNGSPQIIDVGKVTSNLPGWETTSVWNIEGTMQLKYMLIDSLKAESITDGILTLGDEKDGELLVKDDENHTNTTINSQRMEIPLYDNNFNRIGTIYIGKDIGIQAVSNEGAIWYGNQISWTSVSNENYKNNVNYYSSQNFNSLLVPGTDYKEGTPIQGTVYTCLCQDMFNITKLRITDNLTFNTNGNDIIKTITMNFTEDNKLHKGIGFIKAY